MNTSDTETLCSEAYASMKQFHDAIKNAVEKPLLERILELESKIVVESLHTADDKTPGQVAFEAFMDNDSDWNESSYQAHWRRAASAVLAAFGGQASLEAGIKRMESVPVSELIAAYCEGPGIGGMAEACRQVRARLIAAAKEGHGPQAEQNYTEIRIHDQNDGWPRREPVIEGVDWQARAEKAEAELARVTENRNKLDRQLTLKLLSEPEPAFSQLRPISEAGPVPDGCVRFNAQFCPNGKWYMGVDDNNNDTHFADILLPSQAEYHLPKIPNPLQVADPYASWQPARSLTTSPTAGGPRSRRLTSVNKI